MKCVVRDRLRMQFDVRGADVSHLVRDDLVGRRFASRPLAKAYRVRGRVHVHAQMLSADVEAQADEACAELFTPTDTSSHRQAYTQLFGTTISVRFVPRRSMHRTHVKTAGNEMCVEHLLHVLVGSRFAARPLAKAYRVRGREQVHAQMVLVDVETQADGLRVERFMTTDASSHCCAY